MAYKMHKLYGYFYSAWMFFISFDLSLVQDSECITPAEVDEHLQMGMKLIATGDMQGALSHLHAAIDGDPNNYISYYRRATVLLALGRSKMGLQDLDSTIELKPDFIAARVQRSSVLLKMGRLDEAYVELEKVLQKDNQNEDARRLIILHDELKEHILSARYAIDTQLYEESLQSLKYIIESSPWDHHAREMRSKAYIALGDLSSAIADLRVISKLTQDNTDCFMRLSNLYYQMGDAELSLAEIRECLKLDPDHKQCFSFYKKVKKISKSISNIKQFLNNKKYNECVTESKKILNEEKSEAQIRFIALSKLCQCEAKSGSISSAISSCSEALKVNEEPHLYCDRADAYILDENYDDAIRDYKKALELHENFQRAQEGMNKAQKLKKQSGKRDYYKILGVKRNADEKDINKAYRTLARKWHPDHYSGEDKSKAEKMFIDIAAAKEVLTDPEKRQKFDQGEDPLDPDQHQGFHGSGFPFGQQFFRQRGGFGFGDDMPFEFKFHFN